MWANTVSCGGKFCSLFPATGSGTPFPTFVRAVKFCAGSISESRRPAPDGGARWR